MIISITVTMICFVTIILAHRQARRSDARCFWSRGGGRCRL